MTTPVPATDGRSARSKRTRLAVVDALLDLLRAGNLRPTAREIADRAEVSLRSVYVHFDDLEDLFCAAAERQRHLVKDLLYEVPADGPLAERARALAMQRGRLYDEVDAVRRASEIQEPFSPTLSRFGERTRRMARDDAARVFAAELDRLDPAARAERFAVVDALTSSQTWAVLRATHGLEPSRAVEALTHALVAVLEDDA